MAAPMRDGPLDGGHRSRAPDARAAPRTDQPNAAPNNFEYDDNEWDIGIGDLIIDLDADIEKTDEGTAAGGAAMASAAGAPGKTAAKMGADHSATLDKGLKMKIKRTKPGTKTSEAKHEIVKTNEVNGVVEVVVEGAAVLPVAGAVPAGAVPARRSSGAHRRDKTTRDKHAPADQANGVVAPPAAGAAQPPTVTTPAIAVAAVVEPPAQPPVPVAPPLPPIDASPPPAKKPKMDSKDSADVCVGTSVGTITEPDCLGPCEPGTSVTLEGIVWHETEGGVLVVNVTWRGKTYVGTLLDCTRHDWAPPRFCDSPTEELDARTPKGRGKRGRAAAPGGDLSNFTETRSSVHSKLRNGGAKGRRGAAGTAGATPGPVPAVRDAPSPPPTPKAEPPPVAILTPAGKRKSRAPDEESPAVKRRVPASPPASPALLECPEPNCSKKYKHINGLKYHQSHAHGAIEEDDTKDVASMSENDESNAEAPSPAGPVKSPEKIQEPVTPKKEERPEVTAPPVLPIRAPSPVVPVVPTPTVIPSQPPPTGVPPVVVPPVIPTAAAAEPKPTVVKPGVLRFGPQEDFPVANFANKPPAPITPIPAIAAPVAVVARPPEPLPQQFPLQLPQTHATPPPVLPVQHAPPQNPHPIHAPHPSLAAHPVLPPINHVQHPALPVPLVGSLLPHGVVSPAHQKGLPPSPQNPQFKVKPTAALMPTEDKKLQDARLITKPQGFKKNKNRKSPGGSPLPPEQVPFGMEPSNRDDVQSPAYSDISDDTAPAMDVEADKIKVPGEKKPDGVPPLPHSIPPTYGMYQFYGQSPYMVNQPVADPGKLKDDIGKPLDGKPVPEKEIKRENPPESMIAQKMLPQHFYQYGYMPPGYPYNMDPNYGSISLLPEDRMKEQQERDGRERSKESPSPADHSNGKPPMASPQQPQHMQSSKLKPDMMKESKHPNENHQILKESIEMKSQMHPYLYQRQQQAQQFHQQHQQQQQAQHQQKEDEMRRYYMSVDHQRRKENSMNQEGGKSQQMQQQQPPPSNKSHSNQGGQSKMSSGKDQKPPEDVSKSSSKEDIKPVIKQEGQKPTMETTGPPPPPTSQYYLHSPYMQPSPYSVPFDHYRQMVAGPYGPGPFIHPSPMPRYHAPEDLSRPPPSPKSIDLLQHASQYYSSHKIHELQERALKSPTPKAPPGPGGSPGVAPGGPPTGAPPPPPAKPGSQPSPSSSESPASGKDSRSPPPQRHVHTHHHTHVGLGYPLYPAPYGAAVIASQQAASVTVVNSFPPK